MKHTEGLTKLAPALVAAQRDMKAVGKDAKNPHFKNTYASLDAIIDAVRPVLAQHGLAVAQGATVPMTTDSGALVGFAVETMLIHSSGEWLTNTAIVPIQQASPQSAGAALTYGRRYSLSALLSIATEEDDDGNRAAAPQRPVATSGAPLPAPLGDNGSHAKRMPFGKKKGTPLGELDSAELDSTIAWAKKTDAEKFKDLIAACEDVLRDRMATENEEIPF